jgi:ribosomal protein L22
MEEETIKQEIKKEEKVVGTENRQGKEEVKVDNKEKKEAKVEKEKKEDKTEIKEEVKEEIKERKEEKKEKKEEKVKKNEAILRGKDLPLSTKQAVAICRFIKGKKIDEAINGLEKIIRMEKALPMKGELPHRKGMERGRYPITACKIFVKLLKNLNANSQVNGLNEPYIFAAVPNKAPQPFRRGGSMRFKRTHVYLETREIKETKENKQGKKLENKQGKKVEGKKEIKEEKKEEKK